MDKIEQEIRKQWFGTHVATLTTHGDVKVLEWAELGTNVYSCRYVFDGNKMYISGDIGSAVFLLTWKASVHSFNDVGIYYFDEKLAAYSGERRDFNNDKAVMRIKEWRNGFDEDGQEYDSEMMDDLISDTLGSSSRDEWAIDCVNGRYNDFISKLDQDYWEWFYSIGDGIPMRIHAYLIGLKMASEQLKEMI